MNYIKQLVDTYGMFAVFTLVLIEYACFPLPSEVILPLSGVFASYKNIPLYTIIIVTSIAGIIGCLICYYIGYYGGNVILIKIKNKYKKTQKGIEVAIQKYNKYQNIAVSIGRIIPICRTYISFIAGINKQNLYKFLILSLLGIVTWNSILVSLGFIFYNSLDKVYDIYNKYKYICLTMIIVFVMILIIIKIKKGRKKC